MFGYVLFAVVVIIQPIAQVAKTLRLRPEWIVAPILVTYVVLSYKYGMIVSLMGNQ